MKLRGLRRIRIGLAILVPILDGHEVRNLHDSLGRRESGLQDVGVLHVGLVDTRVRAVGLDAEPTSDVLVEDGSEDAG